MTAQNDCEVRFNCSKCGRLIFNDTVVYFEDPAAVAAWWRFRESPRDPEVYGEWKAFCESAVGECLSDRAVRFYGSAFADHKRLAEWDRKLNDDAFNHDGLVIVPLPENAKELDLLRCEHCNHINSLR